MSNINYFRTTIEVIKGKLQSKNYLVTIEKPIQAGHQIRLSTGAVINVYETGRIILGGKPDLELKELLGFIRE